MTNEAPFDPSTFAASFKGFMDSMRHSAPEPEPPLLRRMREHFGDDPAGLPIVSENFAGHDHPNVHLAAEAVISRAERSFDAIGVRADFKPMGLSLSDVIGKGHYAASEAPIDYFNFQRDDGSILACIQNALFLIRDGDQRMALLFRGPIHENYDDRVRVQLMARDQNAGERILSEIRTEIHRRNVYRGKIISVCANEYGRGISLQFHHLPHIDRRDIILPGGVLERIERLTVGFGQHRDLLHAAGRHLKRGILLHGPPGTGKTLTAMHLAGRMRDRTTFLITGSGFRALAPTCAMARALAPAMVILEDVDLIAEDREQADQCSQPLLFELLNAMEGLGDDMDVIFLLTSNRPERLERALAARPGRVDQAVEVPAPDQSCRKRLIDLYAKGLTLDESVDIADLVNRSEGVSAAFIRELLRKAALFAADEHAAKTAAPGALCISARHVDEAMHELMIAGGLLTQRLLGVDRSSTASGASY